MSDLYISRVANGWTISEDHERERGMKPAERNVYVARTVEELTALVAKLVQPEKTGLPFATTPIHSESWPSS